MKANFSSPTAFSGFLPLAFVYVLLSVFRMEIFCCKCCCCCCFCCLRSKAILSLDFYLFFPSAIWWLCRVCGGLFFHISRSCMKHLQLLLLFFFFFLLTFCFRPQFTSKLYSFSHMGVDGSFYSQELVNFIAQFPSHRLSAPFPAHFSFHLACHQKCTHTQMLLQSMWRN